MKYRFNYGSDVISLPKSAAEHLGSVSRESLAVLISLASEKSMSDKRRAEELGITPETLDSAIRYWSAVGVISAEGAAAAQTDTKTADAKRNGQPKNAHGAGAEGVAAAGNAGEAAGSKTAVTGSKTEAAGRKTVAAGSKTAAAGSRSEAGKKKPAGVLDSSTPHLTIPELAGHAGTEKTALLLEYCQQKMGRMLNSAEAERIVGICDYLGVSSNFVALLCDNLKKEGHLTTRALENLAIELHDRGITDYDALTAYIDHREKARSFEGKVRKLFGLGSRALTPAERKMLEKWAELGTSSEMIDFAYELTVSTTGNASLKYSNAIIESWAADGVTNVEEAKKREEDFRQRSSKKSSGRTERKKKAGEQTHSSFDTDDDFFEKALRRSFGNDFYDNVWNGEQADSGDGDKK